MLRRCNCDSFRRDGWDRVGRDESGECARTKFICEEKDDGILIGIGAAEGAYDGRVERRTYHLNDGASPSPRQLRCRGRHSGSMILLQPWNRPAKDGITICANGQEADRYNENSRVVYAPNGSAGMIDCPPNPRVS